MVSWKFSKSSRLLKKEDFLGLRYDAFKIYGTFLWAYVKERERGRCSRIAMSISKSTGNAVRRNFLKRVVRETFRTSLYKIENRDILVVISPKIFKKIPKKRKAGEKVREGLETIFEKIEESSATSHV